MFFAAISMQQEHFDFACILPQFYQSRKLSDETSLLSGVSGQLHAHDELKGK